ncbi:MAG: CDP-alcohol phosphatidyltransferase family protein [Bacteroidota bacterium]
MKAYLPNFVTLMNLFCGCLALVAILNHYYQYVFLIMIFAFITDFADGLLARALKVKSPLGAELDSLADMVSFGLVPGAMFYILLQNRLNGDQLLSFSFNWKAMAGFMVTLFSALRLAKFNIDTRQSSGFLGLATPAAAAFVTGVYLIYYDQSLGYREWAGNIWFLYTSIVAISFLLVSEIPMFSFKYDHMRWRGNEVRFSFIIICLTLLFTLKILAIPILVTLYVLLSISLAIFAPKS